MPQRFPLFIAVMLFIFAASLRLLGMGLRHEFEMPSGPVGMEAGVIAQHIIHGEGFASPFDPVKPPSPSTHMAPLYPLFLAGLMKAGLSSVAIFAISICINLIASSLLPVVALRIGQVAGFPMLESFLAALGLCVCPEAFRAVGLVWDECLFALLTAVFLWWMLARIARMDATGDAAATTAPRRLPWFDSFLLGTGNGFLALLNPAMVIAIPLAWLAAMRAKAVAWKTIAAHALLVTAMTLAASSPWHIRNWFLLDPPARVFIRGNLWMEIWSTMNPLIATATPDGGVKYVPVHPWHDTESLDRVENGTPRHLTEQEYFAWCRERAIAAFREQPRLLVQLIANQFSGFWLGIGEAQRWHRNVALFFLAQGVPAILGILGLYAARRAIAPHVLAVFCIMLIVFPLPYYLAGGAARYRHPIDIILYFGVASLAGVLIETFKRRGVSP